MSPWAQFCSLYDFKRYSEDFEKLDCPEDLDRVINDHEELDAAFSWYEMELVAQKLGWDVGTEDFGSAQDDGWDFDERTKHARDFLKYIQMLEVSKLEEYL